MLLTVSIMPPRTSYRRPDTHLARAFLREMAAGTPLAMTLAAIEHNNAVRMAEDHVHIVFRKQDGDPSLSMRFTYQLHHGDTLGRRHGLPLVHPSAAA